MSRISRKRMNESELRAYEKYLGERLAPIKPRPEFVPGLREHLLQLPTVRTNRDVKSYIPFIVAGVLGGLIILVTGVRATVSILASLGVLHSVKQQLQESGKTAPVQPAI